MIEPLVAGYLTTILVLSAVWFAVSFIPRQPHVNANSSGFLNSLTNWDGVWYAKIAHEGYSYDSNRESSVAFFPAYPVAARLVRKLTGCPVEIALLLVSHACLLGVFILLVRYATVRFPEESPSNIQLVALCFGLWPTTMFFRMAYSESLFLLVTLLAMYGMLRNWHPLAAVLLAGLATACRPVGVALIPVVAWWLWTERKSVTGFLWRSAVLLPLACWGIVAYMAYQYVQFGDPLAFVKTQQHWVMRQSPDWPEYTLSLLTLEPIWSVYVPSSPAYWERFEPVDNPLFSLQFANPIFVVVTVGLVILGWWKKWLTSHEVLLCAGLLLIPYVTHSYRAVMMAQGRYAASVFPVYIVLARMLKHCPPALVGVLCALSGLMLGLYAALFAAWYRII